MHFWRKEQRFLREDKIKSEKLKVESEELKM
jgi:hypothetical protein